MINGDAFLNKLYGDHPDRIINSKNISFFFLIPII